MNAFFQSSCGPWSRRRWLATLLVLPLVRLPRLTAATVLGMADLQARVPALVRRREALADTISAFRAGGSVVIDEAMQQFGQVVAEFAANPKARLQALAWALSQYADADVRASYGLQVRNAHLDGSVTSFGAGDYKCNKLVADAYAVGAQVGLSVGADWTSDGEGTGWPALRSEGSIWPPKANELARPEWNSRSLTNARPLRQPGEPKAQPELGDLIAFPSDGPRGHVGLYVGKNLILSAKETGLEIGPIEAEQTEHGGVVRIRKFTGTGR